MTTVDVLPGIGDIRTDFSRSFCKCFVKHFDGRASSVRPALDALLMRLAKRYPEPLQIVVMHRLHAKMCLGTEMHGGSDDGVLREWKRRVRLGWDSLDSFTVDCENMLTWAASHRPDLARRLLASWKKHLDRFKIEVRLSDSRLEHCKGLIGPKPRAKRSGKNRG